MLHDMQNMQDAQLPPDSASPGLLTTKEVQALVNVDRSTIYRMAEDGRIPAVKVGRQWRFPADEIYAWLHGERTAPTNREAGDGVGRPAVPGASLQALADLMGSALGVMVIITDIEGRPLTRVANPCGMFRTASSTPDTLERCIEGWKEFGSDPDLVPHFTSSHLGFLCARTFVREGSELTAMVIAGGIAPDRWPPPIEEIRGIAAEVGIDPEELAEHADEVYRLDDEGKRRILDLLPKLGVLISQMSTDTARIQRRLDSIAALAGRQSERSAT
jgi:excisionase family DNA binding protein